MSDGLDQPDAGASPVKKYCGIALLACLTFASIASAAAAAPAGRITNGSKVDAGAFQERWRSIVSIRQGMRGGSFGESGSDREMHGCGGVLIANRIVVTAAHCVSEVAGDLRNVTVLGGTRRLSNDRRRSSGVSVRVAEAIVHPHFNPSFEGGMDHDVAVLRLARRIPGTQPVALVGAAEAATWGDGAGLKGGARVAGWGLTTPVVDYDAIFESDEVDPGLETQQVLQETTISLMADRFCGSSDSGMGQDAARFDRRTMLCGGTPDTIRGDASDRRGACHGDSGGPLLVSGPDGRSRLVGLVSWGPSAGGPCNRLSVFTRVAALRGWIADTADSLSRPSGLVAPSKLVVHERTLDSLRLGWSPPAGPVERIRLLRDMSLLELYQDQFGLDPDDLPAELVKALRSARFRTEVGRAGAGVDRIRAVGLSPRSKRSTRVYRVRVEVSNVEGRAVLGPVTRVVPATDGSPPARPRPPRVRNMRHGVPNIAWNLVRDNHCIQGYTVQARRVGTRAWRVVGGTTASNCAQRPDEMWDEEPINRLALYDMRRGAYLVRVVALDRAGNRAPSRPARIRVPRNVPDVGLEDECRIKGDRVICNYPLEDY